MTAWLNVIGIGEDGIDGVAPMLRGLIERAELIVGGDRHLAMLPDMPARKITWASPLRLTVEEVLGWRGKPVVVLATGDPMHYGIGVTFAKHVARDEIAIYPHLSAFTLAAARLAWPLSEVDCLTLHGRPPELLAAAIAPGQRLMILSNDGQTPAEVARRLTALGYGDSDIIVLEHMGGPRERVVSCKAADWQDQPTADFNTVAVTCKAVPGTRLLHRGFGLPDDAFLHDGKLTKREIRAATLAALQPMPGQLLWDVGAGSGSVAIEWLRQHRTANAVAIESDPERQRMIEQNALNLGVPQLKLVAGWAPAIFAGLKQPDAIFIGGGLSEAGLVDAAWHALKPGGRLVANAVTLEGEAALLAAWQKFAGDLSRIAVSRASPIGPYHGWKPLMPITQWSVCK